ncbi:MAG: response regulator [Spirochaetales bacterium]|nr:response regulator [Spirochaetales bacterium]
MISTPGTVLVVDDDALNREVLRRMLTKMGWTIDLASGGVAAIELCKATRYDVILVDLLMPVLDGRQTALAIRSGYEARGHDPCIIAVTGLECGTGTDDDFDACLRKPFVMSELTACVSKALDERR